MVDGGWWMAGRVIEAWNGSGKKAWAEIDTKARPVVIFALFPF